MFERRVAVVLAVVVLIALALLARAGQVQLAQAASWRQQAADAMSRTELTEARRGRILDVKGRPLAEAVPCNDAAVAYWYVDGSYLDVTADTPKVASSHLYKEVARPIARATTANYAQLPRGEQHAAVLAALPAAKDQVEAMWDELAAAGGMTRAEVDAARAEIVDRIENRRMRVVTGRYRAAIQDHIDGDVEAWWRRWLMGEADAPPNIAQFEEPIAEELQAHTILPDISTGAYNRLKKDLADLPGLTLRASQTRRYPAGPVAAHVVGRVASVDRGDLADDPNTSDELLAYLPRDVAGRSGLELVAEARLRGKRGRIDHDLESDVGDEGTLVSEPEPGEDVRSTIDLDLQRSINEAFKHVQFQWPDQHDGRDKAWDEGPAPGGAVVIDVATGAIRALVSYPDYDPNTYADDFFKLVNDDVNRPLTNRATDFAAEPGSTVKPIIGLGAITDGVLSPHETILCDGYFHWNNTTYTHSFRCWTASMFGRYASVQRHQTGGDPHPTAGLNPGFTPDAGEMTFADALQRSCNVYFETAAARLGEAGENKWFTAFGLGKTFGTGLPEKPGLLPRDLTEDERKDQGYVDRNVWLAGIGQGHVQATPLQMANVAATLARDGQVIQPTLVEADAKEALVGKTDLHLNPEALVLLHRGMKAVMRTEGGSGHAIDEQLPVEIAAKTGTAQAAPLTVARRDADGEFVRDADTGRIVYDKLARSTRDAVNPAAPWYRRENDPAEDNAKQSHSWFVGYAPADHPTVAFAVFVEYGGSGGRGAGSVVPPMIEALVKYGYLTPTRELDPKSVAGEKKYLTGPPWP